MKIISSQQYIDISIMERKMQEMEGLSEITLPCGLIGEIDGEEMAILLDGHHRLAAARELGIVVKYDIGDDPDGLTGEDALAARWMDGDWYDVDNSDPISGMFALIF